MNKTSLILLVLALLGSVPLAAQELEPRAYSASPIGANFLVANEMIDISTTRTAALQAHAPGIIFALLASVSLVCSFIAGFDAAGRKNRSWVHSIGFAAILAITFYVILDLEYPRVGLIRLTSVDHVLVEVRQNMK